MLAGFILGTLWGMVITSMLFLCKSPLSTAERDGLVASLGSDTFIGSEEES